jgi:glycosyltransferase involved in cell wall biosynthesis
MLVAGDGPLRDTLASAAPPGVEFLGRLDGAGVDALLSRSRAAVVPSEWAENAPMAVLEPMALGRPVIASRMGGIPEQERDGRDGILIPPGDAQALAQALRTLDDDADLAAHMGEAGRLRAIERFGPAAPTDGLLQIDDGVLRQAA